jgi:hypothetical protein
LLPNENKINPNLQQVEESRNEISKSVSEDKIRPVTPLSHSQRYNIPQIKRKAFMGQISALWGRFQKKRRLKLLN